MQARPNPLKTKSFQFALEVVAFSHILNQGQHYVVAKQLLKSGTSIGANIHEAQSPESKNDFVHKLKIAAKEASETEFWLLLCKESQHLPARSRLSEVVQSSLDCATAIPGTDMNSKT